MHIVIVVVVVRHADFDMTHASWNCRATSSNQKHARTLPGLRQAQPALVSDRLWVCMHTDPDSRSQFMPVQRQ